MDRATAARIEAKLDEVLARVEALEAVLSGSKAGPVARQQPLIHDPELRKRLHERVALLEQHGVYERMRRRFRDEATEHDDPDWWLRRMLDDADIDDPLKP